MTDSSKKLSQDRLSFFCCNNLTFHVSGSPESVSEQQTQLILQLNSSLWHIIVTYHICRKQLQISLLIRESIFFAPMYKVQSFVKFFVKNVIVSINYRIEDFHSLDKGQKISAVIFLGFIYCSG